MVTRFGLLDGEDPLDEVMTGLSLNPSSIKMSMLGNSFKKSDDGPVPLL